MTEPDWNAIAAALQARRRRQDPSSRESLRQALLCAHIENRLVVPYGGGQPTDPRWTERRLVSLSTRTLRRLEEVTAKIREHTPRNVQPMQLAALLLETATEQLDDRNIESLLR